MKYITTVDEQEFIVEIVDDGHVTINGEEVHINFESVPGQPVYSLLLEGKSYEAYIYQEDGEWTVMMRGTRYQISVEDEREKRLRAASGGSGGVSGEFTLKAPMPGLVVAVPIKEGQEVAKGDVLVILESMKMQNELKSPRDGVVKRVKVAAGDSVEQKVAMVIVE